MREGEEIWYCSRIQQENAEVEEYEAPVKEYVRFPRPFSPISLTVQPKNGITDRFNYGETTIKDQRIILTPYQYWHNKFHVGDLFYLDGQKPNEDEEYYGQDANYYVENVANQQEAIELSVKKIVDK